MAHHGSHKEAAVHYLLPRGNLVCTKEEMYLRGARRHVDDVVVAQPESLQLKSKGGVGVAMHYRARMHIDKVLDETCRKKKRKRKSNRTEACRHTKINKHSSRAHKSLRQSPGVHER